MGKNSVMVVHGGGCMVIRKRQRKDGVNNLMLLPENVRNRLVLENCEKCFSIKDCLEISR